MNNNNCPIFTIPIDVIINILPSHLPDSKTIASLSLSCKRFQLLLTKAKNLFNLEKVVFCDLYYPRDILTQLEHEEYSKYDNGYTYFVKHNGRVIGEIKRAVILDYYWNGYLYLRGTLWKHFQKKNVNQLAKTVKRQLNLTIPEITFVAKNKIGWDHNHCYDLTHYSTLHQVINEVKYMYYVASNVKLNI